MTGRFAGAATTLVQRLPGTVPITHRKRGGYVDVDHRSRPGPGQPTPTGRHWHNRSEQTFRRISREESYHGRERKHRALSARQRRRHQRHHLVAGVGSARPIAQAQVPVNQLGPAQRGGQDQPSIVDQRWSSKGNCSDLRGSADYSAYCGRATEHGISTANRFRPLKREQLRRRQGNRVIDGRLVIGWEIEG